VAANRQVKRVLILGAAGRDFHNFNVCFRDDPDSLVVAFTAAQIPGIESRRYPPSLSGSLYPDGIPIYAEEKLEELIRTEHIQQVISPTAMCLMSPSCTSLPVRWPAVRTLV
jgi:predicted GTPase